MADPTTRAPVAAAPTIKVGDPVWVLGRVLGTPAGEPPAIKPGFQIRFESTIPHGATVVVLPREIVALAPDVEV